ncbi:MAG: calcium-binding protein [Sphingomonas bacterium]
MVNIGGNLVLGGIPTIRVSNDGEGGHDLLVAIERVVGTNYSDRVIVTDLNAPELNRDLLSFNRFDRIDLGTTETPAIDDDLLDMSQAGRSTTTTGFFGTTTVNYGVRVDLRDADNQTVQYLNGSALTSGTGGYLAGLYAGLLGRSDIMLRIANANSVIGTQYDDILIGNAGKQSDGEGYSTLHGGAGNDFLAGRGWESHLYGDTGKDEFSVGSNTWVEDGEAGDTVDWGIRLTGGVNQWWQQSGYAYWAPFSSLSAAFPVIGSELIYTAAFFIDQVTMKFARYRLDSDGTLEVNLWGQTASAAIKNYNLDLTSGVGTAGVTVFSSGHGADTSALGKPARDAGLEQFINLALKAGFGVGFGSFDPLVLDLNGDGYNLTSEGASKAYFEFDGDGFAEHTGWLRATDGFLVRDANGNGSIDNVTEMFGNQTSPGFAVLGTYDSNGDGKIDASDSVFASLQVWQDLDQDGVTDAGELKTLSQLGIVSISLTSTTPATATNVAGNAIVHEGSFTRSDGTTGKIADVALAINETNSKYLGDTSVSSAAAALPQLDGFGEVKDLRIAMSSDATLLSEVSSFVTNVTSDLSVLVAEAQAILFRWAGVDGATVTALGSNGFDARKLAFLEKYSGYTLMPRATNGAIDLDNLPQVEALWLNQVTRLTLRLVVQGPLASEFSAIHYDAARDLMVANGPTALADLLHARLLDLPSDATAAAAEWAAWAPLLGALSDGMVRSDGNAVTGDYLFAQLVSAMDGVTQPLTLAQLASGLHVADIRLGTAADETLVRGTAGETAIYFGGGGNDVLTGGTGQDVYVFGRTVGHATIHDIEANPAGDRIRFAFLSQNDVNLERSGDDLLITVKATGETVRVTGQFAAVVAIGSDLLLSSDKGIEDIQFADGSIMELPEIMAAVGKGTDGNDHLVGTMHSDVLTGGKGDDQIEGGDDADLYVFNRGDGNDVIHDQQTTPLLRAADLLVFGDNIAPEDLTYNRSGENGDDLLITVGDSGGSILIQGAFAYTSLGYNGFLAPNSRIEMFAFRNYGDAFTNKDLQQQLIAQETTVGNDVTHGFGDDDTFAASAGNDVLIGMDGADIYDWGAGAGNDIIREQAQYIDVNVGLGGISLTVRADVVQFSEDINPSSLLFTRNYDTDDLTITNTTTGETLTVDGQFNSFQTGVLGAQWFDRVEWFAFADNSAYSWKDVEAIVTTGGAGNDRLRGDIIADTMVGGLGNDLLSGGGGGDSYVFNLGDGHDTVFDDNPTLIGDGFLTVEQTIDAIELGAGINPGDVVFSRAGSSITLTFDSSGDAITLQGQDDYIQTGVFGAIPTSRIEQVKFHDGTIWSWQDVNQKMIAAQTTAGNDITEGFKLSDRFEKSAGDDVMRGGDSGDTYVFGVGAGHDRIEESITNVLYGDDDSVEFDNSVSVADVSVSREDNDLILTLASGDSLRVAGEFDLQTLYTWTDVENFRFADGTVWSKAAVQQMLLQSTPGDDHLLGFYSSDDLDGGAGNDILEGGDGSDTYHFDRGYGNDEIRESVAQVNVGDFDRVVFGPTLLPGDLTVGREGNDLLLTVADTGETLRITGQFTFGNWFAWNDVELFTFANGTQWTDIDIATKLTGGTSGDDHLVGTFRSDTLDGKGGNDLLEGGDGSDIYLFGRGYGHDEIRESLSNANLDEDDEVRFGANITLADLGFTRVDDNLVISINGTDDTLTLTGEFTYSYPYTWNDVERFTFADGSYITKDQASQMVLTGSAGNDHIIGFGSDDTLDGGAGDDILEGMNGSDTYRFGVGGGHDTVIETLTDGRTSEFDTLSFKDGVLPGNVTVTRDGQDAIFTLSSGDSIRVQGQFNEGYNEFLSYNDVEQAVFADGTVWDKIEIDRRSIHGTAGDDLMLGSRYAQTYNGGAGNDTIYGGGNSDIINGGLGNDRLEGDAGDDTYIYNPGDGDDIIHDYNYGNDGADRIVFGAGIAPSDLRFSNNPADASEIIISFATGPGSIRVQNQWWGDAGIEGLEFADGTVWNQGQIAAAWIAGQATAGDDTVFGSSGSDVVAGGAGNDHLLAGAGDDLITGGTGNDRLEGDAGNDTYVYNLGDGDDVIYDYNWNNDQADRIILGAGITPEALHLANNGNGSDVRISFEGSAGSILIQNQWQGDAGIEFIEFSDGTIWDQNQIAARFVAGQSTSGNDEIFSPFGGAVNGGAGNDLIHTGDAEDVITGGTGNDRLESGYGNDRYVYNLGDGDDVIYDYSWNNDQADRIVFGAGITPAGVRLINNGNGSDLKIMFDGGPGSILVQNQWQGDAGIEFIDFADGTTWDLGQIAAHFVNDQSTSGNDLIYGSPFGGAVDAGAGNDNVLTGDGNDSITGGTGNDRLESGYGNDRYIYNLGDGDDVIHDYSWNNDQADRIVFGASIAPGRVLIDAFGSDGAIRLTFKDADGSIAVENQSWGDAGIEFVDFADGTTWDSSQINAHVGRATRNADTLTAAAGGEELWALEGNDQINGSSAADSLHGQAGADTIFGNAGDDVVDGGAGDDALFGDDNATGGRSIVGSNLVVNGSFEQSGTVIGSGGWGIANDTLPGWTKDNSQPFEQVYPYGGVLATDGSFWLDMDSGGGSGSNMSIHQTFAGLTEGSVYRLQFDQANRTSASNGGLEVYWNGVLVASYSDSHTDMRNAAFDLVAGAGDNVLTFKGTGSEDNTGASLDNVQLHATVESNSTGGDDRLTGGAGDDILNGGGGSDVATYSGISADYTVTANEDGSYTVEDLIADRDGADTLYSVETLRFTDSDFAPLDLSGGGQQALRSTSYYSVQGVAPIEHSADADSAHASRDVAPGLFWGGDAWPFQSEIESKRLGGLDGTPHPMLEPPGLAVAADTLGRSPIPASVSAAASLLVQSMASFDVGPAGEISHDRRGARVDSDLWMPDHRGSAGHIRPFDIAA